MELLKKQLGDFSKLEDEAKAIQNAKIMVLKSAEAQ